MIETVKHIHILVAGIAVFLFVVSFIRLKMDLHEGITPLLQKLLTIANIVLVLLGLILMSLLQINPFERQNYWLLEKIVAVGFYIAMIKVALNIKSTKKLQYLTFLGAFGWLAYIGKLAVSHQAILLVGLK